jgi:hypothetical protein
VLYEIRIVTSTCRGKLRSAQRYGDEAVEAKEVTETFWKRRHGGKEAAEDDNTVDPVTLP